MTIKELVTTFNQAYFKNTMAPIADCIEEVCASHEGNFENIEFKHKTQVLEFDSLKTAAKVRCSIYGALGRRKVKFEITNLALPQNEFETECYINKTPKQGVLNCVKENSTIVVKMFLECFEFLGFNKWNYLLPLVIADVEWQQYYHNAHMDVVTVRNFNKGPENKFDTFAEFHYTKKFAVHPKTRVEKTMAFWEKQSNKLTLKNIYQYSLVCDWDKHFNLDIVQEKVLYEELYKKLQDEKTQNLKNKDKHKMKKSQQKFVKKIITRKMKKLN
ncbi:MAG: hypothetical protein ACOX6H_03070 [Christensenellales bacterium]|jgi:hypothetical protein